MELLKNISERMKGDKKFSTLVYVLVAVLGIMMFSGVFSGFNSKNDGYTEKIGDSGSISYTETETKLERILETVLGAGEVNVMVSVVKENGSERITGVIVTSEGAKDIGVKLKLHDAVCTVLELENEKVEIFEMKEVEKYEKD